MSDLSVTGSKLFGNVDVNKVNKAVTLSASIAHEMRNCLAAIDIRRRLIASELGDIALALKSADHFLQNIQLPLKGILEDKSITEGLVPCSIAKNIQEALEQYPFEKDERKLVTVTAGDFEYIGNSILTNHIIYNLLKNAIRAIKGIGEGDIMIRIEPGDEYNTLSFIDTATGIPQDFLPKIFDTFASKMVAQGGTGIGLAFCKLIMEAYSGTIACNSVDGYTEFVLKFPLIK